MKFNVTYAWYDEDAFMQGEPLESGYVDKDLSLREALRLTDETEDNCIDGRSVEEDHSDYREARSIRVCNNMSWCSGISEDRTLHFPDNLTPASRARLCRLLCG